jgi:phage terminase large subunit-like protein
LSARPWESYADGTALDHFVEFARDNLILSTDRWAGHPLKLYPQQRRFMGEALSFDEAGVPCFNSVVWVVARKNGKTNLLAAVAVWKLVTSQDMPEILLAAASDRNAGRLFKAAARFIQRSPHLSKLARVREYAGEIAREDGLGMIYRVASDPNRLHGYDPSLVIADELGQWTKPSLEDAYAALTSGGGARGAPQTFTITTAGEASTRHSSILGRLLTAAEEAPDRELAPGLTISRLPEANMLVYNYEAPTQDPLNLKAMKLANPAPWITTAYLKRQASNPEMTKAQVLQLHGCVWAAEETTFVAPEHLAAAVQRGAGRELRPDEPCVLAFDGSETRDETWIVAVTLDGFVQPLARWQRPKGAGEHWRVPRPEVHAAIDRAMNSFDVIELCPDPPGWYTELDEWVDRYGEDRVVAFETRQPSRMAPACDRTKAAFLGGEIGIGGPLSLELLAHFGNAVTRQTPYGIVINKDHPDSPRRIDGAVATCIGVDRAAWHSLNEEEEDFAFVIDPRPTKEG